MIKEDSDFSTREDYVDADGLTPAVGDLDFSNNTLTSLPDNICEISANLTSFNIGLNYKPYIIAEMSANHCGDFDKAIEFYNKSIDSVNILFFRECDTFKNVYIP